MLTFFKYLSVITFTNVIVDVRITWDNW